MRLLGGPFHEIRGVRGAGAALKSVFRSPVPCGQHGDGEFAISDLDRPWIDGVAGAALGLAFALGLSRGHPDVLAPGFGGGAELGGDRRLGVLHGLRLSGVGDHVEEVSVGVEAMGLRTHADAFGPRVEDQARRPVGVLAAQQQRRKVTSVEGAVAGALDAGEGEDGRAEVHGAGDAVDLRAGLDASGPAHEQRRAHAAFIGGPLDALHAAGPPMAVGAVVGEVDHDRVPLEVQFAELGEDAADVAVQVLHHGEDAAGLLLSFGRGVGRALGQREVLELVPVLGGHGPRGMRGGERDVAQEGALLVALDELQRPVGEDVHDVALGLLHDAVALKGCVEILAPVA